MKYIHVKHDTAEGKNRWSVGPYSQKEAVNKLKQTMERHWKWHKARPDRKVICVIRLQENGDL